jgi:hypothetical protein
MMAKYSKKAHDKIEQVMHGFKTGKLGSGKGGKVTTSGPATGPTTIACV